MMFNTKKYFLDPSFARQGAPEALLRTGTRWPSAEQRLHTAAQRLRTARAEAARALAIRRRVLTIA